MSCIGELAFIPASGLRYLASGKIGVNMNANHRLKKNKEFQAVFRAGISKANRQFVVYQLDRPDQPSFRFGLSVSKRVGNAVVRNRIKRRIREAMRELEPRLSIKKDYVIIARKPTANMSFHEIKSSLVHVFKRAGILRPLSGGRHR